MSNSFFVKKLLNSAIIICCFHYISIKKLNFIFRAFEVSETWTTARMRVFLLATQTPLFAPSLALFGALWTVWTWRSLAAARNWLFNLFQLQLQAPTPNLRASRTRELIPWPEKEKFLCVSKKYQSHPTQTQMNCELFRHSVDWVACPTNPCLFLKTSANEYHRRTGDKVVGISIETCPAMFP